MYDVAIEGVVMSELEPNDTNPPIVQRQPGRPRTRQIRSRGEHGPGIKCSYCGQVGRHNRIGCPVRIQDLAT
jgi:hypothetical protein